MFVVSFANVGLSLNVPNSDPTITTATSVEYLAAAGVRVDPQVALLAASEFAA